MKKKIIFITGNKGKLAEAKSILPQIEGKNIDLPEIQEIDARKVIEAKLKEAFKHHKGEYIVEDTSLYFDALDGLPGPLIKWFLQTIGDKKLADIAFKFKNKGAEARTVIGYINKSGKTTYFEGAVKGTITAPKGENGFGWDKIFIPNGYKKSFGQMDLEEKNKISMRKIAFQKLAKFLGI